MESKSSDKRHALLIFNLFMIILLSVILIPSVNAFQGINITHAYSFEECLATGGAIDSITDNQANLSLVGNIENVSGVKGCARQNSLGTKAYYLNSTAVARFNWSDTYPYTVSLWLNNLGSVNDTNPESATQLGTRSLDYTVKVAKYNGKEYVGMSNVNTITTSSLPNNNTWVNIIAVVESGRLLIYYNGVLQGNNTDAYRTILTNYTNIKIFSDSTNTRGFKGAVDEVYYFKGQPTTQDIADLSSGNSTSFYPFMLPSRTYTTLLWSPTDINSTTFIQVNYTLNVSSSDTTYPTATATLFWRIVQSLMPCSIYYQKSCHAVNNTYYNKTMTKVNNQSYFAQLDDNDVFPGYYPYDDSFIEASPKQNYTSYTNNNIKFNIYNFTTYTGQLFLSTEFNAINLSGGNPIGIYYCNSSYTSGTPVTNTNCELQDSFIPDNLLNLFHEHGLNSSHFVVPLQPTIPKTQLSYIIFATVGTAANGYRFRYSLNSSYDNTSFNIGQFNSWSSTNFIFDMHIHQFLGSDYIQLFANYSDNESIKSTSNIITDFFNITQYAPSAPIFINPSCNEKFPISTDNQTIFFNWTRSVDLNNDSVNYNLTLTNGAVSYMRYTPNTSLNWSINLSAGDWSFGLYACDAFACDRTIGCSLNICTSSYIKRIEPCVNNVRLISYYDANSCGSGLGLPADDNLTESCISPPVDVRLGLPDSIYLIAILITLLVISLKIALYSQGIWKSALILSGLLLAGISFVLMDYVRSGITSFSTSLVIISYAIFSLLGIVSIILVISGFVLLFNFEKK